MRFREILEKRKGSANTFQRERLNGREKGGRREREREREREVSVSSIHFKITGADYWSLFKPCGC